MARNVIGEAVITVGADSSQFDKQLPGQIENTGTKSGNRFTSAMGRTLKVGALAAGASVAGLIGVSLAKGFARLSAIDQAKGKLRGLGYTAKDITKVMENALASVKGTAFGLDAAAGASAQFVAAGIKPGKDLTKTLKLLADTATIAGTDLSEMSGVFGKVAATGKLNGESLAQLQERGIPVLSAIAKKYKVTQAAANKMVTSGKIDFKEFQGVMDDVLGGAALEGGKTFKGAMDNTNAALGRLGAAALGGLFSKIPGLLEDIQGWLDSLAPKAKEWGEKAGEAFDKIYKAVTDFWNAPETVEFREKLGEGIEKLGKFITETGIPALGDLKDAVLGVVNFFKDNDTALKGLIGTIGTIGTLMVAAWVAQATIATINAIKVVIAWFTTAAASNTSATIQSKSTAQIVLGWIIQSTKAAYHMAKIVAVTVAGWIRIALVASAKMAWTVIKVVAGFIAQAAVATAQMAIMVAKTVAGWIVMGAVAAAQMALMVIKVVAGFILMTATAVIQMGIAVITTVAGWISMAAAAMANAVVIAAAWLIALGPIGWIIIAIVAVIGIFALLWIKVEGFRNFMKAAWDAIKNAVMVAVKFIWSLIVAYFNLYKTIIMTVFNAIKTVVMNVWNWIKEFIRGAIERIKIIIDGIKTVYNKVKDAFGRAYNAVKEKLGAVVDFVKGIPGKVKTALGNLGKTLYNAGKDLIQGLINGATSLLSKIGTFFLDKLPGWIKEPFKKALGISSPSKVFEGYGKNIGQGLVRGLTGERDKIKSTIRDIAAELKKAGVSQVVRARIAAQGARLLQLASVRDALSAQIETARDNLRALRDEAKQAITSIKDAIIESGNVTQPKTFVDIIANLKTAVSQAQEFATVTNALRKAGLNQTALDQILSAGPQNGLESAQAILAAGPAGIAEVNDLQSQLSAQADRVGTVAYYALYKAGIDGAAGLVEGLIQKKADIEKVMLDIATGMTAAIKKALGIKSPSKVMAGLGENVSKGFVNGIESYSKDAQGAMLKMVEPPQGFKTSLEVGSTLMKRPGRLSDQVKSDGLATTGSTVNNFDVNLEIRDLAELKTVREFIERMKIDRVQARQVARSGKVNA